MSSPSNAWREIDDGGIEVESTATLADDRPLGDGLVQLVSGHGHPGRQSSAAAAA
jgi:hypothetical protein